MTEPWTPGPWRWNDAYGVVEDAEGKEVANPRYDDDGPVIAAAPEMAELLERIVKNPTKWPYNNWAGEVGALLSRIRGEA